MTHGLLQVLVARTKNDEMRRAGPARPPARLAPDAADPSPVTLRFGFPDDANAMARLAALDSSEVPSGPVLLAEVAGEPRAALSLRDGAVIADPFQHTTQVVDLLHIRATQLGRGPGKRRRWRWQRPGMARVRGRSAYT